MNPEIKYGLITGAGVCLWIIAEYLLGFHTTRPEIGEYSGFFSNLIPLITLFLLLKGKHKSVTDGPLRVGQGLSSGLYASFIAALIVYVFLLAYNQFINPGWLDNALDWKVAQMRAQGVTETDIRKQITFYRQANSPAGLLATTIVGMTLVGASFSFGLTLLLRRQPRLPSA